MSIGEIEKEIIMNENDAKQLRSVSDFNGAWLCRREIMKLKKILHKKMM